MRRAALLALAAAALPGCGGDDIAANASKPTLADDGGSKLVDPARTPYINALERRPDGSYLLTTNRGLWRVVDGQATQIKDARITLEQGTSRVGTFLELADVGTGDLLGSGHPDDAGGLPQFLGILRSPDEGRTWKLVDRLGTADLHIIRRVGDVIYAWDAVLGAVLVTDPQFSKIEERFTPRSLVLDMVVDPEDPKLILISTQDEVYRSTDQGRSWRPLAAEPRTRMAWTDDGSLFRAKADGTWQTSDDEGSSWTDVGKMPGEPWKIDAQDATTFDVALADGSITTSTDGGRTWRLTFKAPS